MVIRVIRARVKKGRWLEYVELCKAKSLSLMEGRPGCVGSHICEAHNGRPNVVVYATVWEDKESLQKFTAIHANGTDWQEVTPFSWESHIVVAAHVRYVADDFASLVTMWQELSPYVRHREPTMTSPELTDETWNAIAPILAAKKDPK